MYTYINMYKYIYVYIHTYVYIYIDISSRGSSFLALIHLLSDAFVAVFFVLLGLVCHIYIWHTHMSRVTHTYESMH